MDPVLPLILLLFPVFWCGLSLALARMSGWSTLSKHFPDSLERVEAPHSMRSARFAEKVNYGGMLTVGIGPQGLQLRVLLPFRVGHPPLLIPWNQIRHLESGTRVFTSFHRFDLGGRIQVRFHGSLGEQIRVRVDGGTIALRGDAASQGSKVDGKPLEESPEPQLTGGEPRDAPPLPPVEATQRATADTRCPYCHDDLNVGPAEACAHCGTLHHGDCMAEHGGCVVQGCSGQRGRSRV